MTLSFATICVDPAEAPIFRVPSLTGATPHLVLMDSIDVSLIPSSLITDATAAAWWRQLAAVAEQAAAWHDEHAEGAR